MLSYAAPSSLPLLNEFPIDICKTISLFCLKSLFIDIPLLGILQKTPLEMLDNQYGVPTVSYTKIVPALLLH